LLIQFGLFLIIFFTPVDVLDCIVDSKQICPNELPPGDLVMVLVCPEDEVNNIGSDSPNEHSAYQIAHKNPILVGELINKHQEYQETY